MLSIIADAMAFASRAKPQHDAHKKRYRDKSRNARQEADHRAEMLELMRTRMR